MNDGNGMRQPDSADKSMGDIVKEASEKASLLVREEIELAKAEVQEKGKRLGKGIAAGVAAGVFVVFALIYFFDALSWFFVDLLDTNAVWVGFLITFFILVALGVVAGLLARRWFKTGPPTPDLAIEEAKKTVEVLEETAEGHEHTAPPGAPAPDQVKEASGPSQEVSP
jgi:uncharacterized membrane protein YqjE